MREVIAEAVPLLRSRTSLCCQQASSVHALSEGTFQIVTVLFSWTTQAWVLDQNQLTGSTRETRWGSLRVGSTEALGQSQWR